MIEYSKEVFQELSKLFVESYIFYLKIYNYYWNVIGLMFYSLYLLFEQQYIELVMVVDIIVECICVLGDKVLGSYVVFVWLFLVKDVEGDLDVMEMLKMLIVDYCIVVECVNKVFKLVVGYEDEGIVVIVSE